MVTAIVISAYLKCKDNHQLYSLDYAISGFNTLLCLHFEL